MCMSVSLCDFVYHMGAGPYRGQKGALNPLELELEIAVCLHVGAGSQTRVFYKDSKNSWLLSNLSNSSTYLLK